MFHRFLPRLLLGLLVVTATGLVLAFAIASFGLVEGEEFTPDTFQRRSYWYYELPLIRIQISPVRHMPSPYSLQQTLIKGNYIAPQSPPQRWDLVAAERLGRTWRQGDAMILCQYLDASDAENSMTRYWETWTNKHPTLAKILWPEIAILARNELYFLIPPLFDKALAADNPSTLQQELNQLLARSYEELAKAELALQHLERAARFFTDALRYEPHRTTSLEGQSQCYTALGKRQYTTRDPQIGPPAEK